MVGAGAGDEHAAARSVASARAQTEDVEVLLVGGGSDGGGVAEESRAGRERCVAARGATLGATLQTALEEARAPYVLLLRAGEELEPDAVARHLSAIEAYPPRAASVARWDPSACPLWEEGSGAARGAVLRAVLRGAPPPLAAALLRRDLALAAGGFDATFVAAAAEDYWLRFLLAHPVRGIDAVLVHGAREPDDRARDPRHAELGRALVRAAWTWSPDALVAAACGDAWVDPAEARLGLARDLLASGVADARPLVHRLLAEAYALGGEPPEDEAFSGFRSCAPELARRGLPVAMRLGGTAPADGAVDLAARRDPALRAPARRAAFPPRLAVALAAAELSATGGDAALDRAAELEDAGIDVVLLSGIDESATQRDAWAARGLRVETLQWGSSYEAKALFERCGVHALVAAPDGDLARVAGEAGVIVLHRLPAPGDVDLAAALRAAVLAAARTGRAVHAAAADAAWTACATERAAMEALRVVAAGVAHPESITGRGLARGVDDAQRDDLSAITRDAESLAALGPVLRLRAVRILDKLRLGHRFGAGVRSLRARLGGGHAPAPAAALDVAALDAFLARAAERDGWLWVVYATDPYSETRGQRSTWLAQELARRGHHVVYLYWRWRPTDAILVSGDPRVLSVPIDQLGSIQARLFRAAAPGLRKVFLAEFPDVALFERVDLFAAHGFVTVYDCIDEWAEFARVGQAYWYDEAVERHVVRNADVVVATHPLLAAHLEAIGAREVPLVPNGVKLESLSPPATPRPRSPVVVGYFGHLTSSWFDWDLVRDAAARHPGWRFEIVGYGEPDGLELPANVVLPGMVPHDQLSARTASWTVGIIPFREGRLTQAVDPVKLYEYLALGLPVVAVGMPHLHSVPGVFPCDRAGFDEALVRATSEPLDRARVAEFVAASRWERRVDALVALVGSADDARNVVKALAG